MNAPSATVRLKLFASLREQTGVAEEALPLSPQDTVASLRAQLLSRGPQWAGLADAGRVRAALNQRLVAEDQLVHPGDELAFFPPVTGG